ncbi:hypothetical protein LSH36_167g10015 [Paralvinella palmiformis]|uniref:Uncharacterized protein n=1 Tax=Paralvinella palmiformis TaxID=53620 RepID=A0AAD9JTA8_9ANNE|nr:hypothetical protein LSH36_167g10015 [Paralvinella palmiformis]
MKTGCEPRDEQYLSFDENDVITEVIGSGTLWWIGTLRGDSAAGELSFNGGDVISDVVHTEDGWWIALNQAIYLRLAALKSSLFAASPDTVTLVPDSQPR